MVMIVWVALKFTRRLHWPITVWLLSVPKTKTVMKGDFYEDVPTIQAAVTQVLTNISKTEFKKSMDKSADRSKRCIELNGSYFE